MPKYFWITLLCLQAFAISAFSQAQEAKLLNTWFDNSLIPTSSYNGRYNDIWGYAQNGREYAIIGSTAGVHFLDVTIPEAMEQIEAAFVPGVAQGAQLVHRDFKNFGKYLYVVADEGQSTLQIVDMSFLPDSTAILYSSNEFLRRAHNIFIDTITAHLYTCGVTTATGGVSLQILSLDDPEHPQLLGAYPNGTLNLPYVHDAYVRHDTAYLNCGTSGFWVVDFTDPNTPQVLGTMTDYPQSGYNHSGWLDLAGHYYYLGDETHAKDLKTVDVSDFTDIKVINTFNAESPEQKTIPHNMLLRDNFLYVSYYYDGLQVFDVSDPLNPVHIAYYDTFAEPNNGSYQGAWGVYPLLPSGRVLLSDMQNGLFVFDKIELTSAISEPATTLGALRVFPQPASSQLTLEFNWDNPASECRFALYQVTGTEVLRKELAVSKGNNQITLEIPATLPNGLYFLQMEGTAGVPVSIQH
ncbi:MAG: choice-of-anchor B family protein [Saprospirales bacterium]|nr:choice-of-anchor B family protein [Saprospirales bacterium]MBK8491110.1 choice-of-anchor B family protein [Saprospirales bacterium]